LDTTVTSYAEETINSTNRIQYVEFGRMDHYPHRHEKHIVTIICRTKFWYWTLLERGFGFRTERALDDKDIYGMFYGPKLFWK
jgi:hypothetical protein